MRIAALADTHLGFRQFNAMIDGRNAREVDVERAWHTAIDQIIEAGVDVVTIAGDVFHHPRVSDHAKKAFLDGVRRLVESGIVVVILQGNHDAAKTAEVLTPILLAEGAHDLVRIVTTPKRIRGDTGLEDETYSIACYPYVSRGDGEAYTLEPDPDADINVLVMHAAVKGGSDGEKLPFFYGSDAQALDVGREAGRWDVIAVGDYHEHTKLTPDGRAFYSGSIERTSTNIWAEKQPKGWVLVDIEADTTEFVEIPTRRMADYELADFDLLALTAGASEVNHVLGHLSGNGLADAIVRLKVDDFPREERDNIDWALVRTLKHECLHFELDLRFAAGSQRTSFERSEGRKASLREDAEQFLADDDEGVRGLVLNYFDGVEES